MPVSHIDFYNSIPITADSHEIDLRNSISRNHYSLIHFLSEYSEYFEIPSSVYKTGSHQAIFDKVVEYLEREGHEKVKSLSAMFTGSKAARVKADYKIDLVVGSIDERMACEYLPKIKGLLCIPSEQLDSVES